jgi:flagellar hook-basal body complex protein FliE
MEIKDITQIPELAGIRPPDLERGAEAGKGEGSFANLLKDSVSEVNRLQKEAGEAITAYATGEKASLHDTMIAIEQADVSFRLLMQVRNKIVEAYQEVLRMQV